MSEVVRWMLARLGWFCGHRETFPTDMRTIFMTSLLVRTPSMVLGSFSVMLLAMVCAARLPQSLWPIAWLALEIVVLWARLRIMTAARPALARAENRPFYWYVAFASFWCLLLGLGACMCVVSGDGVLAALAGINVAGVAAGISTRTAAFPRLALLQIMLVGIPYAVGAALTPVPWFFILALEIPMCLAAMSTLALTHHTDTVALIRAERENRFLAFHDSLTGLPNRKSLGDRLAQLCAELANGNPAAGAFAVLCLDLDGFKLVNDTFGHPAGDELLRAVAERLRFEVRESDMVARMGGDEFVIVLPGADHVEAARISERTIAAIAQPFVLDAVASVTIGITIGSAFAPVDGMTGEALLARADAALYAAKRACRGTYCTYAEMRVRARSDAP